MVALKEWLPVVAGEGCLAAAALALSVGVLKHPRLHHRVTDIGLAGGRYGGWFCLSGGRGGDGFFPELGHPPLKLALVCGCRVIGVTDTIPIL